jgi:anti-sigma factor (TIGR02949 family)
MMADCDETLRQLYAYLDEILDADMRAEIESHVGDCDGCRDRIQFESLLMVHIRQRSKEEPLPEDLRRRLLECLDVGVSADTRWDET